jgi:hypothetical protein
MTLQDSMWSELGSSLKRFTSVYGDSHEARLPKDAKTELSRIRHDFVLCAHLNLFLKIAIETF